MIKSKGIILIMVIAILIFFNIITPMAEETPTKVEGIGSIPGEYGYKRNPDLVEVEIRKVYAPMREGIGKPIMATEYNIARELLLNGAVDIICDDPRFKKYTNLNLPYDSTGYAQYYKVNHGGGLTSISPAPIHTGEMMFYPAVSKDTWDERFQVWLDHGGFKFSYGTYVIPELRDIEERILNEKYFDNYVLNVELINMHHLIESLPYVDVTVDLVDLKPESLAWKFKQVMKREAKRENLSLEKYVELIISNEDKKKELYDAALSFWAKDDVKEAIDKGVFVEDEFSPFYMCNIRRDQFSKLLVNWYHRSLGINFFTSDEEACPFWDIEKTMHSKYVAKAYEYGFTEGFHMRTTTLNDNVFVFENHSNITRQEVCHMVYRALCKIDPSIKVSNVKLPFDDVEDISSWALEAVSYCYENNIIKGLENNLIAPLDLLTVEQAIVLLNRLPVSKNAL